LVYQTGAGVTGSQLTWFDRAGKQIGVVGEPAAYGDVGLSPDGKWATVSIANPGGGTRDIWVYDVARGLRTRFTSDPAVEQNSVWSPDGSRVIFNSNRKGHLDLYHKDSSGASAEEVLLEDGFDKYPAAWSPDGQSMLYVSATGPAGAGRDLFVLPLSGEPSTGRKPVPFLRSEFTENYAQFSPDGRWVAYSSNESGREEVYVAPFPGPGGRRLVSTNGGGQARWRPDGTEIFYLAPDNTLMAAAVNGKSGSFEVGTVKPLFQTAASAGTRRAYDISLDGQRFLINTRTQQAASAPITVVVNWLAGVRE
jgi:Tol biopolymer transport system component